MDDNHDSTHILSSTSSSSSSSSSSTSNTPTSTRAPASPRVSHKSHHRHHENTHDTSSPHRTIPPSPQPVPSHRKPLHPNDVSTHRRARELYQYFHPLSFEESLGRDDDTADALLTSQARLVALVLGGKCLINFLDNARQYIVAEADGPTWLEIKESSEPSALSHPTWIECRGSDVTSNSVCQYTVQASAVDNDGLPFFEVEDLSVDPRFSSIPLVVGPPLLKYYGGTPLYAKSGIAVGALVIVDNKPRPKMSKQDISFMHTAAKNIMSILELHRDSRQQKRTSYMNKCLSRFVNPLNQPSDSTLRPSSYENPQREASRTISRPASIDHLGSDNNSATRLASAHGALARAGSLELLSRTSNPETRLSHPPPFQEAAELLRKALGGDSCSVVFLDTVAISIPDTGFDEVKDASPDVSRSRFQSRGQSPVLASCFSSPTSPSTPNIASPGDSGKASFIPLSTKALCSLADAYPTGQVWEFDGEGTACSAPFTPAGDVDFDNPKWTTDGALLRQHFPHASCIVVKPIFNARSHRRVVAIACSNSQFQTFTPEHDIPFINAFCNCVAMELVRLAAVSSDQQKGDFIGSISHELRSPLHGILASCDLLQDTELSTSQKSLVDTANSCGRTLHDTISMVLDWSKVNVFERDWRKVPTLQRRPGKPRLSTSKSTTMTQAHLLPNLYGNVDLAATLEEVVEAAVVGQNFQGVQQQNFADLGSKFQFSTTRSTSSASSTQDATTNVRKAAVEVILDIASSSKGFMFITQPGAFRRMVMNLVGNSCKYTSKGWVRVSMKITEGAAEVSDNAPNDGTVRDLMTLTVEDTGKGISPEYLQTKLFSPFAQEDIIAPGTGLGLSLTKSIIDMLEGEIHVESALGRGTVVTVTIPMIAANASFSADSTPSTAGTLSDSVSALEAVRRLGQGKSVAYFDSASDDSTGSSRLMQQNIHAYVRDWFGIRVTENPSDAEVIFVNDFDLVVLLQSLEVGSSARTIRPIIMVFAASASSARRLQLAQKASGWRIEFVPKPFGPNRLASVLLSCFQTSFQTSQNDMSTPTQAGQTVKSVSPTNEPISGSLRTNLLLDPPRHDIFVNEDSANAAMAMSSQSSTSTVYPLSGDLVESPEMTEFPFPGTLPYNEPEAQEPSSNHVVQVCAPVRQSSDPIAPERRETRILLVDDNSLNLRLLCTYMKKLRYNALTTACDGRVAADAFKASLQKTAPFDVVFMDLSMPVLDGFEATREIRALERKYHDDLPPLSTPSPALIIALTGLASERDQQIAFSAGVDLYLTKPASFKEVGSLLKNWEANGGTLASDRLPHGGLSAVSRQA